MRQLEEALGALAPSPEHRVASSALSWCEVGIKDRTLLVPLRPLGARHLTNHQSTRKNLLTDVLELRLARLGCSLLHSPHLQSLVVGRGSPKYEKAALRWLERYLVESSPRLQHFVEVTATASWMTATAPTPSGRMR